MEKISIINLIDKPISGEWGNDSIDNVGVKVIRTANFTNLGILNTDNIVIRDIEEAKIQSKKLIKGDTIIEKSGGSPTQPVGRVIYFNEDDLYLTNNFTSILRPKKEIIYPKFLFYSLFNLHKNGRTLKHQNKTTGIINLKLTEYLKEEIPLPSYADQIRIANVLDKIEEVIQTRKNAIDQLDELVKATFYDMFGDPVRNEKGWDKDEIGKHTDSIVPGRDKPKSFTGDIPWITTDKLKNLGFLDKNELNIGLTAEEIKSAKSKIIPSQSILMTCVGDLGLVSIADFDCVANQQLHSYQCHDTINNVFGMFCLSYSKSFMYRMASTTTVPYMNKTICNSIPVILPPLDIQNQFAAIAQKIETLKQQQEQQLLEMEALYASVSHAAFSGTLDLTHIPYDERLLPVVEPVNEPEVIDKKKEEPKELENKTPLQLNGLSGKRTKDVLPSTNEWSKLSFKKIAELITNHFQANYFNSEMLLRFLTEEAKLNVDYFSSKEQKLNLKLENANDFLIFLSDAVTDKNPYLKLEQVFYDAEVENIIGITFTTLDLETLSKKTTQERSGIYFRIKNETTTR